MAGFRTYLSTIRYMKPSQITARLSRYLDKRHEKSSLPPKIIRKLRYTPRLYVDILDDDSTVSGRFDVTEISDGRVGLLNEKKEVDFSNMTVKEEATPLWRFNLLYLEYLIPLANRYIQDDKISDKRAIRDILQGAKTSFEENQDARWPYILALQTVNVLIVKDVLSRSTSLFSKRDEDDFLIDLYRKYCYLQRHREKELLANHYFENIKALLILSMAFGEEKKVEQYMKELRSELQEQILPDGMHYERSFMYHKLILEDLMRIVLASHGTPWQERIYTMVGPYIIAMCNFLARVEHYIPRTPFFNDDADNVAKPARSLLKTAERLGFIDLRSIEKNFKSLETNIFYSESSGFFVADRGHQTLLIDLGKIGPDYNPGHAHNSFLSYEIMDRDMPVIVNSGVSCYQGPERAYYRSVAAHNTFTIDDTEPSECWAEHRVGKRIRDIKVTVEEGKVVGEFKNQKGRRGRRIFLFRDDVMKIYDEATDGEKAKITSYIHLAPDFFIVRKYANVYAVSHSSINFSFEIKVTEGNAEIISRDENHPYAEGFGRKEKIDILRMEGNRVSYEIRTTGYDDRNALIRR